MSVAEFEYPGHRGVKPCLLALQVKVKEWIMFGQEEEEKQPLRHNIFTI